MNPRRSPLLLWSLISTFLLLSACATLPEYVPQTPTSAWKSPEQTTAGRIFADDIAANPGKSGVAMLANVELALRMRNAMAGIAEKTLDVQYYIWSSDTVGRLLIHRLVEAADRGVRVRVLLDDQPVKSKDISLATFSSHPNIEIRLFNPLAGRGKGGIAFISEFSRVNHRMHNKLFVMDNAVAVIGGRNIGDRYFGINPKANARDLDMAVVGPAVSGLSETFDLFWNSRWAIPVETLAKETPGPEELEGLKTQLAELVSASLPSLPYSVDIDTPAMYKHLEEARSILKWAPVEILYDTPDKVKTSEARVQNATIVVADEMKEELLMEMAYFVPGKRGVANLKEYVERGIKVKILTNSMASNNVMAAHAGYAKYRKSILEAGGELYEYRPDASDRENWAPAAKEAVTQLHSKTFVIDRKIVFIGTFNLDPRSKVINTEMGVIVRDPWFAGQVADFIEGGMSPANSYRVLPDEKDPEKLLWTTMDGQKEKKYRYDPKTGFFKNLGVAFIRLFPIEGQL